MNLRLLVLTTSALLFSAAQAYADDKWDYQQEVTYQDYHDPMMIWLADGRKLAVSLGAIRYEEISKWPRAKKLQLVFKAGAGVALLDSQTGKKIPVLAGWQKHPIEILQEQCQEKNITTMGTVECTQLAAKRWDSELNFAYSSLQKQVKPEAKESLKLAQRQWLKYRDEQSKAIQAVYRERDGTIWYNQSAQNILEITREQALRLFSLIEQENP